MKKINKYLILFPLFASCSYVSDLKRTGDIITKEYEWNGVSNIEIWAPARVIPVISEESKIELKGMDFIVKGYQFIQSEEKLLIEHKNDRLQESKIADLILYAPKFDNIIVNSPCKLYSADTLHISNLTIVINGKGANTDGSLILKGNSLNFYAYGMNKCKMNFSGEIHSAYYYIQGVTKIDALELSTVSTKIKHKSYSDCYLFATELLDVNIFAPGNVYYKGNPEIIFERTKSNLLNASGEIYKIQ